MIGYNIISKRLFRICAERTDGGKLEDAGKKEKILYHHADILSKRKVAHRHMLYNGRLRRDSAL